MPVGRSTTSGGFKNVIVLVVTTALVCVAAEFTARAFYNPENLGTVVRYDHDLGWSLKPNSSLRSVNYRAGFDYQIDINSHGVRDREFRLRKSTGKRRILILGDSVAFGTGVEEQWRVSSFLARALGDEVEVINSAVSGWGTDQELIHYERFGRQLEADVVVLSVTLANDVINNMLDHLFLDDAPKPRFVLQGDSLHLVNNLPGFAGEFRRHPIKRTLRKSRFLLFVKRRLDAWNYERRARANPVVVTSGFGKQEMERDYSHWSVFEKYPSERMENGHRLTEALIGRLQEVCLQDGAELIVFAIPGKLEVDDEWREHMITHAGVEAERLDFRKPYDRMHSFCARNGIAFLYPLEQFRSASRHRRLNFDNDAHPNQYGHAVAARSLLEILRDRHELAFAIDESDLRVYRDLGWEPR